jgi:serine phosphatase RsbU (regulator of sigma subunit)
MPALGHEPSADLSPDGSVERLPHGPGMALGLVGADLAVDEHASLLLPPVRLLLMYTDGMTDCRDPKGEAFGLSASNYGSARIGMSFSAQQVCDRLLDTLQTFKWLQTG